MLQVAAGMEGHADNAAASLLGGFVVAWDDRRDFARFHAVRLDAHPGIQPVALVAGDASRRQRPPAGCCPSGSRWRTRPSPAAAPRSRVLAFTAAPELLLPATEDRLHQEYRRPAYPESAELVDALRAAGVPAAISGAGPTVLALTTDGGCRPSWTCTGSPALPLAVDAEGARVELG